MPLSQLATVKEIVGPRQITRENNQRFITVQANVIDRDIISFIEEAQQSIDDKVVFPPGYLTTGGGQFRLQQEANKRLAVVIPVTLLIISLLLYSSFNSLKNAALILLNIPLALVGGIIRPVDQRTKSFRAIFGELYRALFGIALETAWSWSPPSINWYAMAYPSTKPPYGAPAFGFGCAATCRS